MRDTDKTKKSDRTRALLVNCAIEIFSIKPAKSVTFAEIARLAEITPQAIYRYFPQKKDLHLAAIGYDFELLMRSVLEKMNPNELPSLSGRLWEHFVEESKNHPLASRAIVSRRGPILDYIDGLESTTELVNHLSAELEIAQKLGLVRTDLPLAGIARSLKRYLVFNNLPLLFEGKFNAPEWYEVTNVILAVLFYPFPDLAVPEALTEFRGKINSALKQARG